jgi:hypothetical protein
MMLQSDPLSPGRMYPEPSRLHALLIILDRMFTVWFIATLAYLNYQARRVTLDKLYGKEYS